MILEFRIVTELPEAYPAAGKQKISMKLGLYQRFAWITSGGLQLLAKLGVVTFLGTTQQLLHHLSAEDICDIFTLRNNSHWHMEHCSFHHPVCSSWRQLAKSSSFSHHSIQKMPGAVSAAITVSQRGLSPKHKNGVSEGAITHQTQVGRALWKMWRKFVITPREIRFKQWGLNPSLLKSPLLCAIPA